jgi:hypothetical protein
MIEEFTPTAPKMKTRDSRASYLGDGGESIPAYENVTEVLVGAFKDSTTIDNVIDSARQVENWLRRAMERQRTGVGSRLYLQIKIDSVDTDWWRSEILGGSLEYDEDLMRALGEKVAPFTLRLERRFYWEGPEVSLDMTSDATAVAASEVTLYNDADDNVSGCNWLEIAAAELEDGTIPSPAVITVAQEEAAGANIVNMYIANNVFNDPGNFDPYLLASEAGGMGNWPWALTGWTTCQEWDLPDALLADCAGYFMRVLFTGVIGALGQDTWARASIMSTSYDNLWAGDAVAITDYNSGVWDLGALPIPPSGYSTGYKNLTLAIQVISTGAGSITPDFIQLMPTTSYRFISSRYSTWISALNDTLVDDGVDGRVYHYDLSETAENPIFMARGDPIHLWPNRLQRLYFLYYGQTWSAVAGNEMGVSIDWRPRRLTI